MRIMNGLTPRNGVRNSVPGVDSIVMCIVKVHSQRIDHRNGVSHSLSGVNPFIMRIYFAHVTGVIDERGENYCMVVCLCTFCAWLASVSFTSKIHGMEGMEMRVLFAEYVKNNGET